MSYDDLNKKMVDLRSDKRFIANGRGKKPLILLFYDGFELQARDGLAGYIRSNLRRIARYSYRSIRRKQVRTGFYTAFLLLVKALRNEEFDVRINNFSLARKYPNYPIGLAGYPTILEKVPLQNPRILGPGDYGYPDAAAAVAQDSRNKVLIQPGEWAAELYRPYCGDKMMAWPVGIDTDQWADASHHAKPTDVLIYDKIRWNRGKVVPELLEPILRSLGDRRLSHKLVRYGHHHHSEFRRELENAKSMIFLCEHETQGLAYQEAMAMNVPVFAWDEGILVDPKQRSFIDAAIFRVSSVPYFDDRCGGKFANMGDFDASFTTFWEKLQDFQPRDYISHELSLQKSAVTYLQAYLRCFEAGS